MSRFDQHVAIVTGGGRGIGEATARLLAEEGARVAVVARTTTEVERVAAELGEHGEHGLAITANVASEPDVERVVRTVTERWGRPSLLVNNAGVVGQGPLVEMSADSWDEVMGVNLRGPWLLTRAFLRDRPAGVGGAIVNVCSISGVPGPPKFPGFAAYAASKAGLLLFTEVAAAEAREAGVQVLAVSPGSTDTVMFRTVAPGVEPDLSPEQVARVILFACSKDAAGMTGRNLDVWG